MTDRRPEGRGQDDGALDALVARAAAVPVDTGRLAAGVRRRLAAQAAAPGLTDWLWALPVPRAVPVALGLALLATPFAVAALPAGDPAAAALAALALGDPLALDPGALPVLR